MSNPLLDQVKQLMYGDGPALQDMVTKVMYGYDSETTATGSTPNEIDLAPKIPELSSMTNNNEHVTFTFGRFSVPHKGHAGLLEAVLEEAAGRPHYVFATHRHDSEKNPLVYETKIDFMRRMFGEAYNIYEGEQVRTLFDAIQFLESEGFKTATLVVGEDRFSVFVKLLESYSHEYTMDIEVACFARADDGASATQMREAAASGDQERFFALAPEGVDHAIVEELYTIVREGMGQTIPTAGESSPGNGRLGADKDIPMDETKERRRKAMKRFKQFVDET